MLNKNDYLTIFHEIKNSITLVGSSLQLIEKKYPEVVDYSHWTESRMELDHLKKIVTELSAARTNNSFAFEKSSVREFLTDSVSSFHTLAAEEFFCELVVEDNLPIIEIDPVRIRQAITNIVKNAYEAMDCCGTVLLHAFRDDDNVCFAITDNGGGIPVEYETRIFDPLVTSKRDGSGLGLTITKKIVEAHHGSLSFLSRPGDGCTFTIRLPIQQS